MSGTSWVRAPIGLAADGVITRSGLRTVLVSVPTLTAGSRLMDVLPLLDGDHRIQAVFSTPQSEGVWHGLEDVVRGWGGLVIPWDQAIRCEWDLVLSASHRQIEQLHGKVLVLPHGAGAAKSMTRSRKAGAATVATTGVDRELLTFRGRVVPSAVALPTDADLAMLATRCPEALPVASVVGDICFDRMAASASMRSHYRAALRADGGRPLIAISSTWSPSSLLGRHPDLYRRVVDEVPDAVVVAIIHPNVWAAHGAWQIRSWLAPAIVEGMEVIPPENGWQAAVVACDALVGDHGSVTSYAAALGRPVCLATFPDGAVRAGSVAHALAGAARRLEHGRPLREQLDRERLGDIGPDVVGAVTSRPGRAAGLLRSMLYRLLDLSEPSWPARVPPVRLSCPVRW